MSQEETYATAIAGSGEVYLLIGALLATALFFLTIYAGLNRKRSYLFFSAYALLGASSLLLLRGHHVLPFLVTFTLACLCLLYFFVTFFGIASKSMAGVALALFVPTVAGFGFFDGTQRTVFLIIAWLTYALTLMACSWIALRAINQNRYGSKLLFATTALIFFLNVVLISDSFFVSTISIASCLLILAVTYTVLQEVHEQNRLVESLRFKAVSLENELLKKYIQPHFLLNTLTVLSEWIEEQPALAVRQIDWLSKEFRFITRVSGETVIPIGEELKICQVHLDMFNARQASHFVLETKGIRAETNVPPMTFHTLIENGLTHAETETGRFVIEQQDAKDETRFRVTAEPLVRHRAGEDGLGLTYIKSRLEQAFPGKWRMTSEATDTAWETIIAIRT